MFVLRTASTAYGELMFYCVDSVTLLQLVP